MTEYFKKLYEFLKNSEIESFSFKTLESFKTFDAELKIDAFCENFVSIKLLFIK